MKIKIDINNNNVYLVRFIFFKEKIGIYDNGIIVFQNHNMIDLINKDNKSKYNIFRKQF